MVGVILFYDETSPFNYAYSRLDTNGTSEESTYVDHNYDGNSYWVRLKITTSESCPVYGGAGYSIWDHVPGEMSIDLKIIYEPIDKSHYNTQTTLADVSIELNKWYIDENIRLKNEFLFLLNLYNINSLVLLNPEPTYFSKYFYRYGIEIGERSHIELDVHHTRLSGLRLTYRSHYLNYLLWGYETKCGQPMRLEDYLCWLFEIKGRELFWVERNGMYLETTASCNALDEEITNEKFEDPEPLNLLPNVKPRTSSILEARKHIFISSKFFSTPIKVNSETNKPYITFSNVTEIIVKSITLIHNIELFLYIRWCHKSYTTEIGIFFYKNKATSNLNIDSLISIFNYRITTDTWISPRSGKFKGKLFNYREKNKTIELYLDLNPAFLPNTVLLFSNFISLRVINKPKVNIETDSLIKYSNRWVPLYKS